MPDLHATKALRWEYIATIASDSAYQVPCAVFPVTNSNKTVIVLPALGIRASFYRHLAKALNSQGFNAVLLEQRGYGESKLSPSRHCDWGFKEWVEQDIPSVYQWTDRQFGADIGLLGHSLGGHMAMCYTALNAGLVSKLILPACGSPWAKAYAGVARYQISLLYHLIPIMNVVFGYYNGKLTGFGGGEARGVMRDWRHLAKHNIYCAAGVEQDIEALLSDFSGRVLSLRYAQDSLAPEMAVEAVLGKLDNADIQRTVLNSNDLFGVSYNQNSGGKNIMADHFSWAKFPNETANRIAEWW